MHNINVCSDLLIELLTVLTQYSVSVREMKRILNMLELTADGKWQRHSGKLLKVMRSMPRKDGPDVFFSFGGTGVCACVFT